MNNLPKMTVRDILSCFVVETEQRNLWKHCIKIPPKASKLGQVVDINSNQLHDKPKMLFRKYAAKAQQ